MKAGGQKYSSGHSLHPVVQATGVQQRRLRSTVVERQSRALFATPRRELVAVSVRPGPPLQLGERRVLFTLPNDMYGGVPEYYTAYDVARDSRFFMLRRAREDSANVRVIVIENFTEELKATARRP